MITKKGTTNMNNQLLYDRESLLRFAFRFTTIAMMCFAFLPLVSGVVPAPDDGYSGAKTAEGRNALFSRTNGVWNTAIGFEALNRNTTGGLHRVTDYQFSSKNTGAALHVTCVVHSMV